MNRKYALALFAILAMFSMACQSLNQVTPSSMDNGAMELEVRAKMAEDIELKAFELGVNVDNGTVTLTGSVDSKDQRRKAGNAAGDVKGVRRVINNITIK